MNNKNEKISILLGNGLNMAFNRVIEELKSDCQKLKLDYPNIFDELGELLQNIGEDIDGIYTVEDAKETLALLNGYRASKVDAKSLDLEEFLGKPEVDRGFITRAIINLFLGDTLYKHSNIRELKGNLSSNLMAADKIFTLNYDLIVYWIFMELVEKSIKSRKDGFVCKSEEGFCHYKKSEQTNLFYLHGASHIFLCDDKQGGAFKVTNKFLKDNCSNIQNRLKSINAVLSKTDVSSSIIFCHGSDEKFNAINNNIYLGSCYDSLKNIDGILIIYGCSFGANTEHDNDEHIWKSVINSNVQTIYIGVDDENYKLKVSKMFRRLCKDSENFPKLMFYIQTAHEINIWKPYREKTWVEIIKEKSSA